ncbi:hypothetical protein F444_22424 [Phytophthora nicotianae P1976]|uniref:Uncharacterized protein n=1 Tax=Phytophthora nicotianae P1976 TaxID=1317066 RepID=A0A080YXU4_PHYNI|nr:hypothetical protein F444_22424 [Phytophthora nicotianae P1976]
MATKPNNGERFIRKSFKNETAVWKTSALDVLILVLPKLVQIVFIRVFVAQHISYQG